MNLNWKWKPAFVEPYLARWRQLEARERRLVAWGGGALVLFLLYATIWAPISADLERLRASVPQNQAKLALMRAQAQEVAQLRARAPAATAGGNLLSTVEQSAMNRGLRQSMTRIEPEGASAARVTFEEVNFNSLISWLAELQKQGVRVENANLQRRPAAGLVSARLVLRGAGA
jgi:general secretion pathway protein M